MLLTTSLLQSHLTNKFCYFSIVIPEIELGSLPRKYKIKKESKYKIKKEGKSFFKNY